MGWVSSSVKACDVQTAELGRGERKKRSKVRVVQWWATAFAGGGLVLVACEPPRAALPPPEYEPAALPAWEPEKSQGISAFDAALAGGEWVTEPDEAANPPIDTAVGGAGGASSGSNL